MTQQIETPQIHASRRGNGRQKYINDKTASGSQQTLTDATLVENLVEGEVMLVACMHFSLETVSDDCEFEVVSTAAVDGGGAVTALHGHQHIFTPAALTATATQKRSFFPPIRVPYSGGARSVTMRITANDSSAVVSCGFDGWIEKEV